MPGLGLVYGGLTRQGRLVFAAFHRALGGCSPALFRSARAGFPPSLAPPCWVSRPAGAWAHPPRKPKAMTLADKVIDIGVQFTCLWRSKSMLLNACATCRFCEGFCGMSSEVCARWFFLPLNCCLFYRHVRKNLNINVM